SQRLVPAVLSVILLAVGWSLGAQRLSQPTTLYQNDQVVLMDIGVPQDIKWSVSPDVVLRRYLELLNELPANTDDIVIWPEGALPFTVLQAPNALDAISAYVGDRRLILGTPRRQPVPRSEAQLVIGGAPAREDEIQYFNSLAVLTKDSNRSGPIALYDKHRLVPFGELPAAKIIPFGEAISAILPTALQRLAKNGFEPGPGPAVVYADGVAPFNGLICYEGIYPNIPRSREARPRAEWMVLVTNDSWFGIGMGPAQHFAQNRYRAIESGLPMARVASRGATAMIDGMGRIVGRGETASGDPEGWRSSVVRAPRPEALPPPPYFRLGDIVFALTLLAFSVLAFLTWRR
ncbi:MAG: apolipoprotein N-acyltransferase, partial [Pseudomonadota bacterium]